MRNNLTHPPWMNLSRNEILWSQKRQMTYPRNARQMKNEVLPVNQNWARVTIDHMHICIGIHRSGPSYMKGQLYISIFRRIGCTFFETNCEGNSAKRNDKRKILFPQLKSERVKNISYRHDIRRIIKSPPLVVIPKSFRKLSVLAWLRFPRSRLRAEKLTAAHNMTFQSILLIMPYDNENTISKGQTKMELETRK